MSTNFPFEFEEEQVQNNPDYAPTPIDLESIQKIEDLPDGSSVFVVGDANAEEEEKASSADSDFYENLAEDIDSGKLNALAARLLDDIKNDRESRKDWEKTVNLAIKYLGVTVEEFRNVPFFRACAAFDTTLAITLMNFFASARAELFPSGGPAKCEIEGMPTDETEDRGERVKMFINYFLTKIDRPYYSDSDKLILYVGLFGSAFRKVVMDPIRNRPCPRLVKPQHLIINNYTTSILESTRITEESFLTRREILIKQRDGIYLEGTLPEVSEDNDDSQSTVDKTIKKTEGIQDGQAENKSLFKIYECHVELGPKEVGDKFGKDHHIPRPYIVEICESTKKICSIRRNWKESDDRYARKECYAHYYYLPGFGIYSLGIAHLLGSNAIVLSDILRQQLDAGTLKNFPGGLRKKGLRMETNDKAIGPSEFLELDTGDAPIGDAIMLMPYGEPSTVLASLRGELREETMALGGASQQGVDNIGSNTPVGTVLAQLEVQNRIPSTILKSMHDSLGYELTLLKELFAEYFGDEPYPFNVPGSNVTIMKEDFSDDVNIVPVSDPNVLTTTHRIIVSEILLKMAQSAPELHDMREAYYRMYTAMNVVNIDKLLPPKEDVKPLDPITENMNAMNKKPVKAGLDQNHEAHITVHQEVLQQVSQQDPQVASALQAHIAEHESMKYFIEMQTAMGIQMPDEQQLQDPQIQNQIAMMAAQAAQQRAQEAAQQNPPPLDPNAVMMADVEQRREASHLKHEEAQLKSETEAFKAQLKFEGDKARMESDKEIAIDKNEVALSIAEMKQPNT